MERRKPAREIAPSSQETSEMRYTRLRTDVQQWIEREQEKRRARQSYNSETDRINHRDLTEADLEFWDKLQSLKPGQPFPMSEWERYDTDFQASGGSSMGSRIDFYAAMGNQVSNRNIRAERERRKKSQG